MGLCASRAADQRAEKISTSIQSELRRDYEQSNTTTRVLFLGTEGSGVSTIFKQLRLIYGDGFSESDRREYKQTIHLNVIRGMQNVCEALVLFGLEGWSHR